MGVGSLVCALRLCVCVCACVWGGTPLCAYRARERNVTLETEITCRRVNKTNNVRLFSLIKEQGIDLFYWKGNFK